MEIISKERFEQFDVRIDPEQFPVDKLVIAGLVHQRNGQTIIFSQNTYPTTPYWDNRDIEIVNEDLVYLTRNVRGKNVRTNLLKKCNDGRCDWFMYSGVDESSSTKFLLCMGSDERDVYEGNCILEVSTCLHDNGRVTYAISAEESIVNGVKKADAKKNRDLRMVNDRFIMKNVHTSKRTRGTEVIGATGYKSSGVQKPVVVLSLDKDCPLMEDREAPTPINEWVCDYIVSREDLEDRDVEFLGYDLITGGASFKESLRDFNVRLDILIPEL